LLANAELTGRSSVIAALWQPGIAEDLHVERLAPEARSAEEPNERSGTGHRMPHRRKMGAHISTYFLNFARNYLLKADAFRFFYSIRS
jgi:hypothetical protein